MWEKIKKMLHNIASEPDNKTICPVRLTALGGTTYAFGCHAYATFLQHVPFDMMAFSGGLGAILATLGASLAVKKDTPKEPE
jgi:hypothetical protein